VSSVGIRESQQLRTWGALRTAAIGLIERYGYDAVSVEAIADAAGVSKRTFFNYFASKDAVIFDPAPNERRLWERLVATVPTDEPVWSSLELFFLGYSGAHRHHLAQQRRVIASSATLTRLGWMAAAQYEDFLTDWTLSRTTWTPAAAMQSRAVVNAAIATLNVAFFAWSPEDEVDVLDELIREAFGAVVTAQIPPTGLRLPPVGRSATGRSRRVRQLAVVGSVGREVR
jgi:AcrR family transcriptional regulator